MLTELTTEIYMLNPEVRMVDLQNKTRQILNIACNLLQLLLPGCRVVVTSGVREDGGTHALGWCVDFDVLVLKHGSYLPFEETFEGKSAMILVKSLIEVALPYGKGNDGKSHHTFVWDTDDAHRGHVHIQVPPHMRF